MNDSYGPAWRSLPPFAAYLGVQVLEVTNQGARLRLPVRDEITNRKGDVHGGAIATLLDLALSYAIRGARPDLSGVSTITITLNYLAPARGELVARSRIARAGRTIAFAEGAVEDSAGDVVATATGSFRQIA